MALFGKKPEPQPESTQPRLPAGMQMIPAKHAYCRICRDHRNFSRCWQRTAQMQGCPCCKQPFENAATLYKKNLPTCPNCSEYLEQPQFTYGLCDGCGSKFELLDGTVPSLLPNHKQRQEMNRFGKSWSPD